MGFYRRLFKIGRMGSVLRSFITENPSAFKGTINEMEFDTIRSILATARTIEPKRKKKYRLE